MRYDDRLTTALRIGTDSEASRSRLWRQLIDLLAQNGGSLSVQGAARAMAALSLLRDAVPLGVRIDTARTVAARCTFLPLLSFHAADASPVVRAMFGAVRLDDASWATVLPDLGPLARGILRSRADLSPRVYAALASFGSVDFTLPNPTPPSATITSPVVDADPPRVEIRDLVRRIEEYRLRKEQAAPNANRVPRPADPGVQTAAVHLNASEATHADTLPLSDTRIVAFETDIDGTILAASGPEQGRIVGLLLSEPAQIGEPGCDAGVARAFSKRGPIRSGRVVTAQDRAFDAVWVCDALPQFHSETGRFLGYVGTLRRASAADGVTIDVIGNGAETDGQAPAALAASDGVRQLMHELRSPLNAINGFAQLIEGQYFGPVSHVYRDIANAIIDDADSLHHAISELDSLARLDRDGLTNGAENCDLAHIARQLIPNYRRHLDAHGADVTVAATGVVLAAVPDALAMRLIDAMLRPVISVLSAGDMVVIQISAQPETGIAHVAIALPTALHGLNATDIDDTSYAIASQHGSPIGVGFSFHLARQLAATANGSLIISHDQYFLNLPLATMQADRLDAIC